MENLLREIYQDYTCNNCDCKKYVYNYNDKDNYTFELEMDDITVTDTVYKKDGRVLIGSRTVTLDKDMDYKEFEAFIDSCISEILL